MGGVLEHDAGEKEFVCRTPGFLAVIDPSLPEQKCAKPLPNLPLIMDGVFTGSNQVAKRLIIGLRYGNRRELPGAVQARQQQSVASVGLDAIGRFARHARGRDHDAAEPAFPEFPNQAIPARTRLMTNREMLRLSKFRQRLGNRADSMRGRAEKPRVFSGAGFGVGNGNRVLVHVQSDVVLCSDLHESLLYVGLGNGESDSGPPVQGHNVLSNVLGRIGDASAKR